MTSPLSPSATEISDFLKSPQGRVALAEARLEADAEGFRALFDAVLGIGSGEPAKLAPESSVDAVRLTLGLYRSTASMDGLSAERQFAYLAGEIEKSVPSDGSPPTLARLALFAARSRAETSKGSPSTGRERDCNGFAQLFAAVLGETDTDPSTLAPAASVEAMRDALADFRRKAKQSELTRQHQLEHVTRLIVKAGKPPRLSRLAKYAAKRGLGADPKRPAKRDSEKPTAEAQAKWAKSDPALADVLNATYDRDGSATGDDVSVSTFDSDATTKVAPRAAKPAKEDKQVAREVSHSMWKRTSEAKLKAWSLTKNLAHMELAAVIFGPHGVGFGSYDDEHMEGCQDPVGAVKHDPVMRAVLDVLLAKFRTQYAMYAKEMAKLSMDKKINNLPFALFDELFPLHVDISCTVLVALSHDHSNPPTWGQTHLTLYNVYTAWSALPAVTSDSVMSCHKARGLSDAHIHWNGKRYVVPLVAALETTAVASTPGSRPIDAPPAPPAAPAPPPPPRRITGNFVPPGTTVPSLAAMRAGAGLCANCYKAGHRGDKCTAKCMRASCHPPHAVHDGHTRARCPQK